MSKTAPVYLNMYERDRYDNVRKASWTTCLPCQRFVSIQTRAARVYADTVITGRGLAYRPSCVQILLIYVPTVLQRPARRRVGRISIAHTRDTRTVRKEYL